MSSNCNFIKSNLVYLNRHTTNISSILSYLYSNEFISPEEKEKIQNPYAYQNKFETCSALYELLERKNISPDDLKNILLETSNEHIVNHLWSAVQVQFTDKSWNLPPKNDIFTGRDGLLGELADKLNLNLLLEKRLDIFSNSSCKLILHGMGGNGKTSLTIEFLYRNRKKFKNIFWLNAEDNSNLNEQLHELGADLGICQKNEKITKLDIILKNLKKFYFHIEKNFNWLIVLDNAQNYTDVEKIFPNFGGSILITSRNSHCWTKISNSVKISGLESPDSILFIRKILGDILINECTELSTEMENLPLALYHACFYVKKYEISIPDYINLFKIHELKFLQEISEGEAISILKSCFISLEKIQNESKLWLQICGNFLPENIPKIFIYEFLRIQGNFPADLEFLKIHENILKFGLFQWNKNEESYSIHRLVQKVIRTCNENFKISDEITFKILINSIGKHKNLKKSQIFQHARYFLFNQMENIQILSQEQVDEIRKLNDQILNLMSSLVHYLDEIHEIDTKFFKYFNFVKNFVEKTKFFKLLCTVGLCFYSRGDLKNSKKFYKKCLEIVSPESLDSVEVFHSLGNIYKDLGKMNKAQDFYEKSLDIRDKNNCQIYTNPEEILTDGILKMNIGIFYFEMGKYQEAMKIYEVSHKIFKDNDCQNPIIGDLLTNMGLVFNKSGKYSEALNYFQDSVKIKIDNFGENCISLFGTYIGIGNSLKSLGKSDEAFEIYKSALEIALKYHDPNNPELAIIYTNIAGSYAEIGDLQMAQEFFEKALEIFEENFGPEYYKSSAIYHGLGEIYRKTNQLRKSLEYFEKALEIEQEYYGINYNNSEKILQSIGSVFIELGEFENAQKYLNSAKNLQIGKYGVEHIDLVEMYNMFGLLNLNCGDFVQALEYHKKALKIQENTYGQNHIYTAESYHWIGVVYGKLNEKEKELDCYKKCLEIKKTHYGEDHQELTCTIINIALACKEQGKFQKSMDLLEKSLKIKCLNVQVTHINTAIALNNIGDLYEIRGDLEKALKYYQDTLKIYQENFKEDNLQANYVLIEIGGIYEQMKNKSKAQKYFETALKIYYDNDCENNTRHEFDDNFHYCKGKCYQYKGDYENAENSFENCLKILISQNGDESISLINGLLALAQINHQNGQINCSLEYFEKIRKIEIKYFGKPTDKTEVYIRELKV